MSMAVDLWSITGKNESIPPCDQLCLKVNWCIQTCLRVLIYHGKDRIHSFSWLAVWQGERMVHQCKSLTRVDKSLIGLDNCFQRLDKTPHIWSKYLIFWYKPTPFDQSREEDLFFFLWLVKSNWDLVEALYCWQEVMQQVLCVLGEPVGELKIKDSDCDCQLFWWSEIMKN